jgi:hypothetical protein
MDQPDEGTALLRLGEAEGQGDGQATWTSPEGGVELGELWAGLPAPSTAVGQATHLELRRGDEVLQRWAFRGAGPA